MCWLQGHIKAPVFQNVDGADVVHWINFLFSEWHINGLPNIHLLYSDLLSGENYGNSIFEKSGPVL